MTAKKERYASEERLGELYLELKDRKVVELMDEGDLALRMLPPNGSKNHKRDNLIQGLRSHRVIVRLIAEMHEGIDSREVTFERYRELDSSKCELCVDSVAEARDRFGVCV